MLKSMNHFKESPKNRPTVYKIRGAAREYKKLVPHNNKLRRARYGSRVVASPWWWLVPWHLASAN